MNPIRLLDLGQVPSPALADRLSRDARFASDEWLHVRGGLTQRSGSGQEQTGVKIHDDVRVAEAACKAPGGLIRATVRLVAGIVEDAAFTGDFTPSAGGGAQCLGGKAAYLCATSCAGYRAGL
jgi:hypothetical protein